MFLAIMATASRVAEGRQNTGAKIVFSILNVYCNGLFIGVNNDTPISHSIIALIARIRKSKWIGIQNIPIDYVVTLLCFW